MRKLIIAVVIIWGISLFTITGADACGDKLLRIGRGARFQRSMLPASVLIYVPSNAPAEASRNGPKLQSFLKKAGHKANIAQGEDQLGQLLNSGQYDVVLTTLADASIVESHAGISTSKPIVVPMMFSATKTEVAAAKKRYRCMVKNPNDGDQYLDAIELAMRSRHG